MDVITHPGNVFCDPVLMAEIVIACNGKVLSAKTTRSSGVPSWDRVVQKVLRLVKYFSSVPEQI